jgi:mono/diheme cytochrome c family protein
MNRFRLFKPQLKMGIGLAVSLAVLYAMASAVLADDTAAKGTAPATKTAPASDPAPAKKQAARPAKKILTGAELYSINCNRCHPERYPTERTSAQWQTLMLHMRVRANLPAAQAKKVLKYLQEDSGS